MSEAIDKLKVIELPNRIRTLDEKTPILIEQNFEELAYSLSKTQKYLNDNLVGKEDASSEFESDAITHGPGEPTD